ncbi:MAG: hypothetical protein HY088_03695 [Ignavibacteriales bacterium]|nr:hypothetical protein [Ignavibacteriales bacterium]
MGKSLKKTSYIALAVLHLAVALFTGIPHVHLPVANYNAQQKITAHNCGAKEVHKSLDKSDHCLVCHRITGSVAFIGFSFSFAELSAKNTHSPAEYAEHSGDIYITASKRGPPAHNS